MHVRTMIGTMIARAATVAMSFVLLCASLAACGLGSAAGNPSAGDTAPEGPLPTAFHGVWQLSQAAPRGVLDYTFASSDPRAGYACTRAGGKLAVFVTPDGGASWKPTAPLPEGDGTYCQLFVDGTDAANLILGRGAADAQMGIEIVAPRLLYRSRDGGRTWTALPGLPPIEGIGSRNTVDGVAILGERVLATVRVDTSSSPTAIGAPTYALYALQTDGHGWTRIDHAFTAQGLVAGGLLAAGTAVLVSAYPGATSPRASASSDSIGQQSIDGFPSNPLSSFSGPVPGAQIWRSTDGGSTWKRISIASTHPALFGFARARDGATVYGVGIDHGGSSNQRTSGLLYSSDGGASWSELPGATSLRDRSGQMFTMSGSSNMIGVAPDGSALAPIQLASESEPDGAQAAAYGVLRLQPGSPDARWMPLVAGPWVDAWRATPTANGIRLWGLRGYTPQGGGDLVYADAL